MKHVLLVENAWVAGLCVAASLLAQLFVFSPAALPVLPAGLGIALGIAVARGPRVAMGVLIGALAGSAIVASNQPQGASGRGLPAALLFGAAIAVASVVCGALLRSRGPASRLLFHVRGVIALTLVGGVLYPTLLTAVLAAESSIGGLGLSLLPASLTSFWIAASGAAMVVAPLVLAAPQLRGAPRRPWEMAACATTLVAACVWAFGPSGPSWLGHAPVHVLVPVLLWAAIRFGTRGTVVAVAAMAVAALATTALRLEPDAGDAAMRRLHLAIVVLSGAFLLLAATLHEREEARKAIERERAELEGRVADRSAALEAERTLSERVIEATGVMLFVLDRQGRIVRVNEASTSLTGYAEEDLLGRPYASLRPDRESGASAARFAKLLRGERASAGDAHLLRKDGSWLEASFSSAPVRGADGSVGGVLITAIDVTARNDTRRRLEEAVSILRTTLDATADGILVVDRERRIVAWNRRFLELWGIGSELLEDRDDESAIASIVGRVKHRSDFMERVRWLERHIDAESDEEIELDDGRIFERYSRPHLLAGEVVGRVSSFRDITSRRRAEQERDRLLVEEGEARRAAEAAYAQVRDAIRFRDEFLASASQAMVPPIDAMEGVLARIERLAPEESAAKVLPLMDQALLQLAQVHGVVDELLRLPEETQPVH
ncbi:PAS domain S-box protein [Vulgatibacter sp.]|uniref:PAS domain S-box protein n=1 Tax=Vulgatibacter sp. TaxID=1971226 RepID=UPI0035692C9F